MPSLFYRVSGWLTATRARGGSLALLLLGSLVAFGSLVGKLSLSGSQPVRPQHVAIIGAMLTLWCLTLAVVWFDPRKRSSRGAFDDWSHAIFLDVFIIICMAALTKIVLAV